MSSVIFFDTDCLASFLWTNSEYVLIHTFKSNMQVPRQVYNELIKVETLKVKVNALIKDKNLIIIDFSANTGEEELYFKLTREERPVIGSGEAAAIALAVYTDGILASNNLGDVRRYVDKFKIKHITTPSILEIALNNKLITMNEAESLWRNMLVYKRRLPSETFADYLKLK